MPTRKYGEFRMNNGGKIYIPPHVEAVPGFASVVTNYNDIDVYEVTTARRFAIGTILTIGVQTWAYCEFGGTTAAGDLLQSELQAVAHDALAAVAGAAGDNTITITSPASGSDDFIVNEYSGGFMRAEVNGSPGYQYPILSHPALDISAVATMVVTLLPGIGTAVAVAATDDFSFMKNPWMEPIIHPSPQTSIICGVSIGIGADGSFGWLGVKGPHAVKTEGTVVIAQEVIASITDDGAVGAAVLTEGTPNTGGNQAPVGVVRDVGADTTFSTIDLNGLGLV